MVRPEVLKAAKKYADMGFKTIRIHGMLDVCTCGSQDPAHNHIFGSGGKHPVASNWTNADTEFELDQLKKSPKDLNIGILTNGLDGPIVIDIDPRNGGTESLAEMVESCPNGIPATLTFSTGNDGLHLVFAPPAGGLAIPSRKGLLPGIDIKASGGQIVAPPSRRRDREYKVSLDCPVVAMPQDLAEFIRDHKTATPASTTTPDQNGARLTNVQAESRYVESTIQIVLNELSNAVEGTRNDVAFHSACRLIEIANAEFAPINQLLTVYLSAADAANLNGDSEFSRDEAMNVWNSAVVKVGSKAAVLPALPVGDLLTLMSMSPDLDPAARGEATMAKADEATATKADGGVSGMPPTHPSVIREIGNMMARAEAKAFIEQQERAVKRREFFGKIASKGMPVNQWRSIPIRSEIIPGFLWADTVARVNGPAGVGKSLILLDLAARVAAGMGWQGRPCLRGSVAYIATEAFASLAVRAPAWERENRRPLPDDCIIYDMPILVNSGEWEALTEYLAALDPKPILIIIDTQAGVSIGVEENSATEITELYGGIETLRRATGAGVLVAHHTGNDTTRGRGSTAAIAMLDTEYLLQREDDGKVIMLMLKNRDGVLDQQFAFEIEAHRVSPDNPDDTRTGAAVRHLLGYEVDPDGVPTGEALERLLGRAMEACRKMLNVDMGVTESAMQAMICPDKRVWPAMFAELASRRVLAKVHFGTARYRYVASEDRASLREPAVKGAAGDGLMMYVAPWKQK
jgi:hypothetical protein